MSPEEIIAYWGRKRLRRYAPEAVRQAAIPQTSKDFLLNVGFPTGDLGATSLHFDDEGFNLPRLPGRTWYCRFGRDEDVPLCVDERRDGCVVEVKTRRTPEGFMNSRVEDFGVFLTLWQQFRTSQHRSQEESLRRLRLCEHKMRQRDPAAFAAPENGWAVILEDLYYLFD